MGEPRYTPNSSQRTTLLSFLCTKTETTLHCQTLSYLRSMMPHNLALQLTSTTPQLHPYHWRHNLFLSQDQIQRLSCFSITNFCTFLLQSEWDSTSFPWRHNLSLSKDQIQRLSCFSITNFCTFLLQSEWDSTSSPRCQSLYIPLSIKATLLLIFTYWVSFRDFGETFAVALHIAKAFDRIWHKALISKLPSYGYYPSLSNFHSDRSIATVVHGHYSSPRSINSGVPHSSVLSPTLFLLFINDLNQKKILALYFTKNMSLIILL